MPVITVEGPPVKDIDKRRSFVDALSRAAAGFYDMPKEKIIIMLRETSPDQVAVGGKLICDKQD